MAGHRALRAEAQQLLQADSARLAERTRVIGVLRSEPGQEPVPLAPRPTLADIARLVEDTRQAGARIDFEMQVDAADALGRDAYRIVQDALTNIGKHAHGTRARVRVAGAPTRGLHVSIRNPPSLNVETGSSAW